MMRLLLWLDSMEARLMTYLVGDLPTITPSVAPVMPAPVVTQPEALTHTCTKGCFSLKA